MPTKSKKELSKHDLHKMARKPITVSPPKDPSEKRKYESTSGRNNPSFRLYDYKTSDTPLGKVIPQFPFPEDDTSNNPKLRDYLHKLVRMVNALITTHNFQVTTGRRLPRASQSDMRRFSHSSKRVALLDELLEMPQLRHTTFWKRYENMVDTLIGEEGLRMAQSSEESINFDSKIGESSYGVDSNVFEKSKGAKGISLTYADIEEELNSLDEVESHLMNPDWDGLSIEQYIQKYEVAIEELGKKITIKSKKK